MGDLRIDTYGKTKDTSCYYLSDLCVTFSLKNITGKSCFKKTTSTLIEILLANRPRSSLKTDSQAHPFIFSIIFFKDSTKNYTIQEI